MDAAVARTARRWGFRRGPAVPAGPRRVRRPRFDWRREIHPVLVNYPAALLVLACLLDLASRSCRPERLASRRRAWLYRLANGTVGVLFAP